MKKMLIDAIELAGAGLRMDEEHIAALQEASTLTLIEAGLSLEEIDTVRRHAQQEVQRINHQRVSYDLNREEFGELVKEAARESREFRRKSSKSHKALADLKTNLSSLNEGMQDVVELPSWCRQNLAEASELINSVEEYIDYVKLSKSLKG